MNETSEKQTRVIVQENSNVFLVTDLGISTAVEPRCKIEVSIIRKVI